MTDIAGGYVNLKIGKRIDAVRSELKSRSMDAFLVLVEENRRYLSGYTGEDGGFDELAGALLITEDRLTLSTDSRFDTQAQKEAVGYEISLYKEGLPEVLPDLLRDLNVHRLGFESNRLSVALHRDIRENLKANDLGVEWVEADDIPQALRMRKDPDEVEYTRQALSIAEEAVVELAQLLSAGMTEKSAAWELEKLMRERGADGLSFPTICASGPNSALPHAIPGDRRLQVGEPVLFDWGARLHGYCSDISRTVLIGRPDSTYRTVYQIVLDAQRLAIDAIRAGVSSKTVDAVARDHIHEKGFGDNFGHGLGHGTGLAIHEPPRLSQLKDTVLETGMIVTVEPGIYLPEWGGIRIENMVVVRENGAEVLNTLDEENFPNILNL